jgi:hypothetical protein
MRHGWHNNADSIDFIDKLFCGCISGAIASFRHVMRCLGVDICHPHQLHIRDVAVDARMDAAEITHADNADA